MSDVQYIKFEQILDLNFDDIRDLQWKSVDDFASYIRANAPFGEICDVHGIGYACKEHEFSQQVLRLVITTRRPKSAVDREKAEQEALRKKQAKLAAIEAAKKAKIDEAKRLQKRVDDLQKELTDNAYELRLHMEKHREDLSRETRGE